MKTRMIRSPRLALGASATLFVHALGVCAFAQEANPPAAGAEPVAAPATSLAKAVPEGQATAPVSEALPEAIPTDVKEDAAAGEGEATQPAPLSAPTDGGNSVATPDVLAQPSAASPRSTTDAERPKVPLSAHYFLGLALDSTYNKDAAWDYFSTDDVDQRFGLMLMWDATELGASVLSLEALLASGESEQVGQRGEIYEGRLTQTDLGLGVQLRYPLWRWFAPYVRLSGGATLTDGLLDTLDGVAKVDKARYFATAGGGLALFSSPIRLSATRRRANSLGAALMVDGGYRLAPAVTFELPAETGGRIRTPAVPLGDVQTRGAFMRIALLAHF